MKFAATVWPPTSTLKPRLFPGTSTKSNWSLYRVPLVTAKSTVGLDGFELQRMDLVISDKRWSFAVLPKFGVIHGSILFCAVNTAPLVNVAVWPAHGLSPTKLASPTMPEAVPPKLSA